LLAIAWLWGLAVFRAGLPARLFGRLLLAESLFLVLATLGVAISFSFSPPTDTSWRWQVGSLYISATPTSVDMALHLVTRALGSVAALNFLALTTPLPDLLELLRRLRVPIFLLDIATLTYRFIFVLLDNLNRMYIAQNCRLGYSSPRRAFRSAGLLGSQLFIETYRRSQRLQTALESRGYTNDLKVLPLQYRRDGVFISLALLLVLSLITVGVLF
jgi:cobalt/nickel transport system permease protein